MKQETILEKRRRQSERIRQMIVAAMLSAITALLVFTPIGMIQLPPPLLSCLQLSRMMRRKRKSRYA